MDDDGKQGLEEDDLLDDAEVDALIRESIVQTLGSDCQFEHSNMNQWTNEIIEGCLKRLAGLGKPFKYVVTCNLAQKVRNLKEFRPSSTRINMFHC